MTVERAVTAFVGPYGSGKTEVAINYALRRLQDCGRVAIVDLDVVTPYFRTREARGRLERLGLRVVTPEGAVALTDLPYVPAEAKWVMEDGSMDVVVDVGGDPPGSRAFGSLVGSVAEHRLDVLFVVNINRPFTRTPGSIAAYVREIEAAVGRRCTGLVSNTHLGTHTTAGTVREGYAIAQAAAEALGVPVTLVCVPGSVAGDPGLVIPPAGVVVLPLRLFMRPPWESDEDDGRAVN